ncbi:MAG: VTT domain-containing protein [Bdellovibrionota bacterium]
MLGTLYATIGLSLGSAIAFILGRFVGLPLIRMMVTEKQMQRFSFVGEKKQGTIVLIVFFIPGFPKDALTYLFSLSRIGFWKFFFLSQIGRLPGTILLTFGASAIFEKNWMMLHLVIWLSLALLLLAFWKRKALMEWLRQ